MRIGHGYDIHRLVKDRKLILGGVLIPYALGLEGHSDADCVLHALTDALLGASALGDIGQLFPPTDPAYKDADSQELIQKAYAQVKQAGWRAVNVDATIVAQAPKLLPYIGDMRKNIARCLELPVGAVGLKATTHEHLGALGRKEGIATHAVCLLEKP